MSTKRKPTQRPPRKPQPAPAQGLSRDEVALIAWHALLHDLVNTRHPHDTADIAFAHADAFIKRAQQ